MGNFNIKRERYILTAQIDRPETMNAVDFELMDQLEQLLDEMENDAELRLFILTGSQKSFISGGDLREFHQIKDSEGAKNMTRRMMSILNRIEKLPCWTLAAINGHTYGGGWETMLAFDFRVAADDATFGFTQGKFYLPPGWGGITKLTKTVGRNRSLYLLGSQKVIDAQTARKYGLIHDLFEAYAFDEKLETLKKSLTRNDRTYIEYIKNFDVETAGDEIEPFSRFWESKEHLKRVDDFLSRKKG